jgi:hypothetical protein
VRKMYPATTVNQILLGFFAAVCYNPSMTSSGAALYSD